MQSIAPTIFKTRSAIIFKRVFAGEGDPTGRPTSARLSQI
jgi:hypothetical protein